MRRRHARTRCARASNGRSRASRSANACAASRRAALDVSDGLTGDLGAHPRGVGRRRATSTSRRCPCAPALSAVARRRGARAGARVPACRRRRLRACASRRRPSARERVAAPQRAARRRALTRIGAIVRGADLRVLDERGAPLAALPRAFDHFAHDAQPDAAFPVPASGAFHRAGLRRRPRAGRAGHVRHAGRDSDRAAARTRTRAMRRSSPRSSCCS